MLMLPCSLVLALSPPDEAPADAVQDADVVVEAESAGPPEPEPIDVVHVEQRVAASPGTGAASNIKGKFRIHLDGNVFAFQHRREWFEPDVDPDEIEDTSNTVGFGIGQYNFGLGLGYGITDGLIVGMKVGVGFSHTRDHDNVPVPDPVEPPDAVYNNVNFLVRPYVEYAFIPGGRFRPFIFVHGGVAGSRFVITDADGNGHNIVHTVGPTLGGGGGLHMFIIPQLSIDVFGEIDHSFVLGRQRILIDGEPPPMTPDPEYVRSHMLTEFSVLVGLSLWFGPGG
jgi:hypothetical protein